MSHAKALIGTLAVCMMASSVAAGSTAAHAGLGRTSKMKPVIAGFIDMQDISWHNTNDGTPSFTLDNVKRFPGLFGGIVFNGTWAEMQPHRNDTELNTARLDQALHEVRAYNRAHPDAPLGVKLRIYAGNQAPRWAKKLDGGPIHIKRNEQGCHTGSCRISIGKVWDPVYIAAWRQFQALLAQRYDSVKAIRSVAITSCAMETDEPFVMPVKQKVPEGYTDRAGKACLRGAVEDYVAWTQTAIDYTINPFLQIQKGGTDMKFSIRIMNACRAALGDRCELGNHSLSTTMPADDAEVVARISRKGAPIHYQTEGPTKPGFAWKPIIREARRKNATAVELWPAADLGGFMSLRRHEMQKLLDLFNGDVL